ncbi:histidine phosphatase family protein [Oceanibacterium hippocampi]|uniref:Phosphoserine phosphatase 1 n=1 Tax=Oceanibacterium hippocampi TaxID=745714 RepID=A0A1Y5RL17_9PROT|nr:histidine phosphatase family protein [Oceanibacterium hippocampi]SLN19993.1 Phosphoserine phosphatase 1 [Oceanibacterium hippocampi]
MIRLALLRHGPTAWNATKRLQGRSDQPLSEAGRATFAGRRLPARFADYALVTSPLLRARETASLVGHGPAQIEPALIEMDFGAWEGCTIAELRERYGDAMKVNEDRGLDMQPPGGESPRAVQRRLDVWLAGLQRDTVAVTHKGVIRALLAAALGWDMTGRQPVRLDWSALHLFACSGGRTDLVEANIPLEAIGD